VKFRRRAGGAAREEVYLNLTSLIDVIFVLLLFFVVTTTFDARSVLKLELPRADGQPAEAGAQPLGILINADGRYFVGSREVLRTDVDALKQALLEVAGDDRSQVVLVRADARTPWQAVVTAYEALGQLGFRKVANATVPAPAAGAGSGQ